MQETRAPRRPTDDRHARLGRSDEIGGLHRDADAVGDRPVGEDRRAYGRNPPPQDHLVGANVLRARDPHIDPGRETRAGGQGPRRPSRTGNGTPLPISTGPRKAKRSTLLARLWQN
jgi:hypothetical protein